MAKIIKNLIHYNFNMYKIKRLGIYLINRSMLFLNKLVIVDIEISDFSCGKLARRWRRALRVSLWNPIPFVSPL